MDRSTLTEADLEILIPVEKQKPKSPLDIDAYFWSDISPNDNQRQKMLALLAKLLLN